MRDLGFEPASNISIVIVSYGSARRLGENLLAALRLLPGCEVVIVENGGKAAAVELDCLYGGIATIVPSGGNVGFGQGCNIGARAAKRELLFFLNPDVAVVGVDWELLMRQLSVAEFGILVATRQVTSGDVPLLQRDRAWRADVLLSLIGKFATPQGVDLLPLERCVCRGELCAIGAAMFVRRAEFLGVGGFDERFFLYCEDRDLSRRYRRAGYPVRATGALVVEHKSGSSTTVDVQRMLAYSFLSMIELAEIWEESGLSAARLVARGLGCFSLLRHLVPIGPLRIPARKGRQARVVQRALFGVPEELPKDKHPYARATLSRLGGCGAGLETIGREGPIVE